MAINYPASLDDDASLHEIVNDLETTLDTSYTTPASTLDLVDGSDFPTTGGIIYVDDERGAYTGRSSDQLTGVTGLASNHDAAVVVEMNIDADHHNDVKDAVVAIETRVGITSSSVAGTLTKRIADMEALAYENNIVTFTSDDTYSKPSNLLYVKVTVIGAGGGGGGSRKGEAVGEAGGGGGGGGGGTVIKTYLDTDLDAGESITVGAGGTGANGSDGTAGATGGNSTFKSLTGSGGVGGNTAAPSANMVFSPKGAGGAASGGDINVAGQDGSGGVAQGTGLDTVIIWAGHGGGSTLSGGMMGTIWGGTADSQYDGDNATGIGSGGPGGIVMNDTDPQYAGGGDGADGIVIIEEYLE